MCAHKRFERYLGWLMLCLPILLNSCIKDEDEVLDDYCYISSVSLGTIKRVVTSGETSTTTTYTGSYYAMTIDQNAGSIWNREPLLYGSDLRAVLLNIKYDGSYLAYKHDYDADWIPYNSNDSIDLRTPIKLYLVANDSQSGREYTMTVNVRGNKEDAFIWEKVEELEAGKGLDGASEAKAALLAGKLVMLCRDASGIKVCRRADLQSPSEWSFENSNLPTDANLQTIQQMGDNLYVSTTGGDIYVSADGTTWTAFGSGKTGLQLVGASESVFYALIDGRLHSSADASDWTKEEKLEDGYVGYTPSDSLPTNVLGTLMFNQSNGNKRLVMVGYNTSDNAVVWNKMWNKNVAEADAEWIYFNHTSDNKQLLPKMTNVVLMGYQGGCIALGGDLSKVYYSNDYGITWRKDSKVTMPNGLTGVTGPVAAAVDDETLWIIANNQVWRGFLNK